MAARDYREMADHDLFRDEVFQARTQRLFGGVVLTQPLSTTVMVCVLLAITTIAGVWVTQGSYARIETVPGILVTDKATAKVYASVPGIITDLVVKEGTYVRKGDRLAVVKLDRQSESGNDVIVRSASSVGDRMRLGEQQLIIASQRMHLERSRLEGVIAAAEQQIVSLDQQAQLQAQVVASNRQIFEQIAKVVERGFVSKVEFERRRQTLIGSEQQLEGLRQQKLSRLSEMDQAQAQINALPVEAARNSGDIRLQLSALEQQKTQLEGERSYVITAPISGRVTAIQIAAGKMATGQSPLMIIIPQGSNLRAELYAPTKAIGFVKPGQQARILFDAFPYQRFGSFGGKIANVSKTVFDPRETDVPIKLEQAVYKITVNLDRQHVVGYGDKIQLQPGMTLNANIVLERQSFLDWIFEPLNAVRKRTA